MTGYLDGHQVTCAIAFIFDIFIVQIAWLFWGERGEMELKSRTLINFLQIFHNHSIFSHRRESTRVPQIISKCVQEVEKRGMYDVGIYRISGLSSEVQRLKKAFERSEYKKYIGANFSNIILAICVKLQYVGGVRLNVLSLRGLTMEIPQPWV